MTHWLSGSCEHSREPADMGDQRPGSSAFDGGFEVFGEPAAASKPSEGAFYNPASGQDFEALSSVRAFDDLHRPAAQRGESTAQLVAGISGIGEDVAQPRIKTADGGQYRNRTVAILDAGDVHDQADQMPRGVRHDVACAALDLLPRVVATRPTALRRLHGLTVDNAGGRARLAVCLLARCHDQCMIDDLPAPIANPLVEVALHGGIR